MRRILLIGGWDELLVRLALLPVQITLIQESSKLTPLQRALVHDVHECDLESTEASDVLRNLQGNSFESVLSLNEDGLLLASALREAYSCSGLDLETVRLCQDKAAMRDKFRGTSLEIASNPVSCVSEALRFWRELNERPFILKPRSGSGSEGVSLIQRESDLVSAWTAIAPYMSAGAIAEEYLDGDEYSVETISVRGDHRVVSMTKKWTFGAPNFVELGHAPMRVPAPMAVESVVSEALSTVGLVTGVAHTEVRSSHSRSAIVEINLRAGGDRIWEITEAATGVDLLQAAVLTLSGMPVPLPAPNRKPWWLGIRYSRSEAEHAALKRNPIIVDRLVREVRQSKVAPADAVSDLNSSGDRTGYFVIADNDPESVDWAITESIRST